MCDHQVGTIMKYNSDDYDFVKSVGKSTRVYQIYRKSETEYEYRRTGNQSLWKGYKTEVVVGCPYEKGPGSNADLTIYYTNHKGQRYCASAYKQTKPYNPFDDE